MRILFILLLIAVGTFASESKDLAFRAERTVRSGKFAKANSLLERALLSSRKESDLKSEGRILISMANLRTQSLDLDFAEKLLGQVRKDDLDSNGLSAYYLAWMEIFLERGNYAKVIDIKYALTEDFLKLMPEGIRGGILCAAAIAFAGQGKDSLSGVYIADARKAFGGDSPGKLAFAEARAASLLQKRSADSLYRNALELSVRANRPFMSATILYYRGLAETDPEIAADYFVRSANAFELMGLSRNRERSLTKEKLSK